MKQIEEVTLFIPDLWSRPWASAIEDAKGVERDAIVVQAHLAKQLKRFADRTPTVQLLAWLCLWSRNYNCVDGLRGAIERNNGLAAEVFERIATEITLHLGAIVQPRLRRGKLESTTELQESNAAGTSSWEYVGQQLVGYIAWCLFADAMFYRKNLDAETVEGVFDPKHARLLIQKLGDARPVWEQFMGEIEEDSDQEVELDRKRAVAFWTGKLERLQVWLNHPELKPWAAQIEGQAKGRRVPSLFQVLGGKESSVRDRLQELEMGFGYVTYIRGSHVIHGSAFEPFMHSGEDFVCPNFGDFGHRLEAKATHILSDLRRNSLMLELLADKLQL
jgi:hypothetical protein